MGEQGKQIERPIFRSSSTLLLKEHDSLMRWNRRCLAIPVDGDSMDMGPWPFVVMKQKFVGFTDDGTDR